VFRFLEDHRRGLIWAHEQRWTSRETLPGDGELEQQVRVAVLDDLLKLSASTLVKFYLGPEDVGRDGVDPEIIKAFEGE
jgi:hypothetical protein